MKVTPTKLDGVLLIAPEPFSKGQGELGVDERGFFLEIYNEAAFAKHGISVKFLQDDISVSKQDVLRGIHGDDHTWKLVTCTRGSIFFVVVNCDRRSPQFGAWQAFDLTEENHYQILIPPNYGNGYLARSTVVTFQYKQSSYYNPSGQFRYRWDEPKFNIHWPIAKPILSERDAHEEYIQ